jgi:hypothetical protein
MDRPDKGLGKEVPIMARHMDIHGYCDGLYSELSNMKDRLNGYLTQIELMKGKEKDVLRSHEKHLKEIIQTIDWKLEIFAKECPVDWSNLGQKSEGSASVPVSESFNEKDYPSGGFAGG